ncbi:MULTISPECIES: cysteine hydrolase family protein [unclassified Dyella]|uniref:cysteine hydrolase family protein n=1 Tax=unclassified Dyella TaxID=2634549 RepID=UPI003F91B2CD
MARINLPCERGRSIELDTARTVLACIDFQADFVLPEGRAGALGLPVEALLAAIPAAQRALSAAREAGMLVFFTRECYAPDLSDLNLFRRQNDLVIGSPGPLGRFLVKGEKGTEIIADLRPADREPVIDKAGFSAFHQTTLDTVLRVRGIDTLLLMGYTTQCCVASTLRQAVDLGYACVLLQDACAAYDPADHEATVRVMYSEGDNFGWVTDTQRLATALHSSRH